MIEKIAQDILDRASIKLAGLSDLFEKIAANAFGVTPNNFNLYTIGNPKIQQQMIQNIRGGKLPQQTLKNLHGVINHPNNSALRASAQQSGLLPTLNNALLNFNQGSKPASAQAVAQRQQMEALRRARAVQNSRVSATTNGTPVFGAFRV